MSLISWHFLRNFKPIRPVYRPYTISFHTYDIGIALQSLHDRRLHFNLSARNAANNPDADFVEQIERNGDED